MQKERLIRQRDKLSKNRAKMEIINSFKKEANSMNKYFENKEHQEFMKSFIILNHSQKVEEEDDDVICLDDSEEETFKSAGDSIHIKQPVIKQENRYQYIPELTV